MDELTKARAELAGRLSQHWPDRQVEVYEDQQLVQHEDGRIERTALTVMYLDRRHDRWAGVLNEKLLEDGPAECAQLFIDYIAEIEARTEAHLADLYEKLFSKNEPAT